MYNIDFYQDAEAEDLTKKEADAKSSLQQNISSIKTIGISDVIKFDQNSLKASALGMSATLVLGLYFKKNLLASGALGIVLGNMSYNIYKKIKK